MRAVIKSMGERLDKENLQSSGHSMIRGKAVRGKSGVFGALLQEGRNDVQVDDDACTARSLQRRYEAEHRASELRRKKQERICAEDDSLARRLARQERLDLQEDEEEEALVRQEEEERAEAKRAAFRRAEAVRLDLVAGERHAQRLGEDEDAKLGAWIAQREELNEQDTTFAANLHRRAEAKANELDALEAEDTELAARVQRKLQRLDAKHTKMEEADAKLAARLQECGSDAEQEDEAEAESKPQTEPKGKKRSSFRNLVWGRR